MYLYLRPGLYDFLDALYEKFELVLFNNGSMNFTGPIVNQLLDNAPSVKKDYFSYILNKEHCSVNDNGNEIKNIDLFCNFDSNRDIEQCLIIDNNIYCFQKQLTNGLLIEKYEGQEQDDWLNALKEYIL